MKDSEQKKTTVTTLVTPGDRNADIITGESGSHPIGTGIGAAGGAAAGAAIGALGGPVGAVAGGVVGAVVGGLAGKGAAEAIDPTVEDTYWRTSYMSSPNFVKSNNYDYNDYGPAYRLGWESRASIADRKFDDVESDLASKWDGAKGSSRLKWNEAKPATRDAWQRVSDSIERMTPGDSDRDGK